MPKICLQRLWRTKAAALFFSSALVLVGGALAQSEAPLVRFMRSGPRTAPIWIDAAAATKSDGSIDWQRFEARAEEVLGPPQPIDPITGECLTVFGETDTDRLDGKSRATLADLIQGSVAIYSGSIDEIHQGFYESIPYSLLRLKVRERFRSSPGIDLNHVEFPYPYANFTLGNRKFCTGTIKNYKPALGDRVILFLYSDAIDSEHMLVTPLTEELLIEDPSGRLIYSDNIGKSLWSSAATFEDFERYIRTEASRGTRQ